MNNMKKLMLLRQGPGLNNVSLFYTARPISTRYCPQSDTTTFTLLGTDASLHIPGSHTAPRDKIISPDVCKLLDILVCGLEDTSPEHPCHVVISLDDFIRLAGYKSTKTNKDSIRPQVKESIELLGKISLSWTEEDKYSYKNVKIFERISFQNAAVSAVFTEQMAQYLLNCPVTELPQSLLSIIKKYYLLGRRCLIHQAVNKERTSQAIRVERLLAACPHIPQPEPDKTWSPSVLERKVINPFTAAMDSLAELRILQWNFKRPGTYSSYEQFIDNIVEFHMLNGLQNGESSLDIDPVRQASTPVLFPINEFLNRCKAHLI